MGNGGIWGIAKNALWGVQKKMCEIGRKREKTRKQYPLKALGAPPLVRTVHAARAHCACNSHE